MIIDDIQRGYSSFVLAKIHRGNESGRNGLGYQNGKSFAIGRLANAHKLNDLIPEAVSTRAGSPFAVVAEEMVQRYADGLARSPEWNGNCINCCAIRRNECLNLEARRLSRNPPCCLKTI